MKEDFDQNSCNLNYLSSAVSMLHTYIHISECTVRIYLPQIDTTFHAIHTSSDILYVRYLSPLRINNPLFPTENVLRHIALPYSFHSASRSHSQSSHQSFTASPLFISSPPSTSSSPSITYLSLLFYPIHFLTTSILLRR